MKVEEGLQILRSQSGRVALGGEAVSPQRGATIVKPREDYERKTRPDRGTPIDELFKSHRVTN